MNALARRPRPRVSMPEICMGVMIKPNGDHELVVEMPSQIVAMKFPLPVIERLARGIEAAKIAITMADAGPDVVRERFVPLEVE